jgi:homoserine kinase type II
MAYLFSIALAALLLARQSDAFVQATRVSARFANMGFSATQTTATETDETSNNIGAIGSKLTDMELAKEALGKFLDYSTGDLEITPTSGGVNNIVQYVTLPSGEKELLRIYNNGCDTHRVKFEHEILRQLNELTLSFSVPCFLPSKQGSTIVRLGNGADACMVKLSPGHLPKLSCAGDIGRAAGELNTALTKIDVDRAMCNCAPYWKMWDVHHAVTRELF